MSQDHQPTPLVMTWNVNSIRARLERVEALLQRWEPDVLCLQETKVSDDAFPSDAIEALGYHVSRHGQKTYNGVAILSRAMPESVESGLVDFDDTAARVLRAQIHDVEYWSVYVPNGQTPESDKYVYKLGFLDALCAMLERPHHAPRVVTGDFNIAPSDADATHPEKWRGTTLCTDAVRARFRQMVDAGFSDALLAGDPSPPPLTWWDYRQLAFPKNDGLRIDHILVEAPLAVVESGVDRNERKGKGASDHAPAWARISSADLTPA